MAIHPSNLPLLDSFTRADGALGGGWAGQRINTGETCAPTIITNRIGSAGFCSDLWGTKYARPVGCRFVVPVLATAVGYPCWLVQDGNTAAPNGYRLRWDPATSWQIQRYTAGVATYSSGGSIAANPIVAGDEVALTLDSDGTLTGWIFSAGAWVAIGAPVVDTAFTGTFAPGTTLGDTTVRLDDLRGGQPTTTGVSAVPIHPARRYQHLLVR